MTAWHDYFLMVGGGAAVFTGLVFVAMTLHLEEITNHPGQRHRARTILTGLTAVFTWCGLALMGGQSDRAVAIELILVLVGVELILLNSLRAAVPVIDTGDLLRTLGILTILLTEQAGAVVALLGSSWGFYVAGVGMMVTFVAMVAGAWQLLVGVMGRRNRTGQPGDSLLT